MNFFKFGCKLHLCRHLREIEREKGRKGLQSDFRIGDIFVIKIYFLKFGVVDSQFGDEIDSTYNQ